MLSVWNPLSAAKIHSINPVALLAINKMGQAVAQFILSLFRVPV